MDCQESLRRGACSLAASPLQHPLPEDTIATSAHNYYEALLDRLAEYKDVRNDAMLERI